MVLIKLAAGKSYTDLLKEIQGKVKPDNLGTECCTKNAIGARENVRRLEPKVALEIRDFHSFTMVEEVKAAITKDLGTDAGSLMVSMTD
ncbi:hypothetical protein J6590_105013 [Homalodisca vitripennis]|nr:hypothetical protein J6590_105013 [Homalodisca vitripennis]